MGERRLLPRTRLDRFRSRPDVAKLDGFSPGTIDRPSGDLLLFMLAAARDTFQTLLVFEGAEIDCDYHKNMGVAVV